MKEIKTIYLGDSVMAFDSKPFDCANDYNQPNEHEICRGYPTLLSERLGLVNIGNYAVGGHGIFDQREIILKTDFKNADLVIITVGSNDFSKGTKIGTLPKTTDESYPETFYGAYAQCLDHIFKSNPKVKVVLMTPIHRNTLHRTGNVPINSIDTVIAGNTLYDFADAVINLGRLYSCPVADMFSNSGLNKINLPEFTFEGVHPTNKGYEFIIDTLISTIKSII